MGIKVFYLNKIGTVWLLKGERVTRVRVDIRLYIIVLGKYIYNLLIGIILSLNKYNMLVALIELRGNFHKKNK